MLSGALCASGDRTTALAAYEQKRNIETRALYHLTCRRASYEPPPAQMIEILEALSRNPAQADRFAGIDAGTVACEDFFNPENIRALLAE